MAGVGAAGWGGTGESMTRAGRSVDGPSAGQAIHRQTAKPSSRAAMAPSPAASLPPESFEYAGSPSRSWASASASAAGSVSRTVATDRAAFGLRLGTASSPFTSAYMRLRARGGTFTCSDSTSVSTWWQAATSARAPSSARAAVSKSAVSSAGRASLK